MIKRTFAAGPLWLAASLALAVMIAGVAMPDTDVLDGKTLKLNGAGVRKKGVFWLGQVNSDRAAQALEKLLTSSGTSEELREQAVFALMQQRTERGEAAVRAVAQDDQAPPSLREKAVFWIGQNRSPANATFLRGLFTRLASTKGDRNEAVAQKILFSLSQMRGEGNDRWLMEVAADPASSDARPSRRK